MQFIKNLWAGVKQVSRNVADKAMAVGTAVVGGIAGALGFSEPAHAAPPDLTSLTAAVDFSTVVTAVLGVAAALIVVYIAWKGAKMVIAAVRGG